MPKFTKRLPPTDPALSARAKAVAASFEPQQIEAALRKQPAQTCPSAQISNSDLHEILERLPERDAAHPERAWTISISPRSIARLFWPIGYAFAFLGGFIALGFGFAIAEATFKLTLPAVETLVSLVKTALG